MGLAFGWCGIGSDAVGCRDGVGKVGTSEWRIVWLIILYREMRMAIFMIGLGEVGKAIKLCTVAT